MRPVAFFVYWTVFAQLVSTNKVCGLTNAEFFDLIQDYVTDIEVVDNESGDIGDYLQDDKDDVINLPGGPDDEIDLEFIADKLGLIPNDNYVETLDHETDDIGDYLQDDNDEDTYLQKGPDDMLDGEYIADEQGLIHNGKDVEDLGKKTDAIVDYLQDGSEDLIYLQGGTDNELAAEYIKDKRGLTSNDEACVTVADLGSNTDLEVTFSINYHRLFHKEISLQDPPRMCFGVPGLKYFSEACLEFYDVDMETKGGCARLAGILDLKIKEFSVDLKLGCFRIPGEQALTNRLNDEDFLSAYVQESSAGSKAVDIHDLDTTYRQLQDVQGHEASDDDW